MSVWISKKFRGDEGHARSSSLTAAVSTVFPGSAFTAGSAACLQKCWGEQPHAHSRDSPGLCPWAQLWDMTCAGSKEKAAVAE